MSGKVVFNLSSFLYPDAPGFIKDLRESSHVEGADQLVCCKCGKSISHISSVEMSGPPKFVVEDEIEVINGVEVLKEKTKVTSKRLVTCTSCVSLNPSGKVRQHLRG